MGQIIKSKLKSSSHQYPFTHTSAQLHFISGDIYLPCVLKPQFQMLDRICRIFTNENTAAICMQIPLLLGYSYLCTLALFEWHWWDLVAMDAGKHCWLVFYIQYHKVRLMFRKKQPDQLEPLKITKTEANYQSLLLDMMSKLVSEQRESNRLLRRLAGETEADLSPSTITKSPSKPIFPAFQKSIPLSEAGHCREDEECSEQQENSSIISSSPFRFIPTILHNAQDLTKVQGSRHSNELQQLTETSEKVVKGIEGLGDILKRIESSLSANLSSIERRQAQSEEAKASKKEKQKDLQHDAPKNNANKENTDKTEQNRGAVDGCKKEENLMKNGFNVADTKNAASKGEGGKKNKVKNQKRDRLSAFDTIRIQKFLEGRLVVKPQVSLCRQLQDRKNYSLLTQVLPYSDKREIKIRVPLEEVMDYYQMKKINDEGEASALTRHWLGSVYRAIASVCWNLLSNHQLTFEETKVLFTENVIYNLIEFMRTVKAFQNSGNKVNRCRLVEDINCTSVAILDFLCTQYPQTKVEDPNIALRNEIPSVDNKGETEFDLISKVSQAKQVVFRRKENGDYTQEIMKTINYMIERSNQEFDHFKDMFSGIFEEVFLPLHKRRQPRGEETHEDQLYFEKVRAYTKYAISQKINKNTPKYSEAEIENGIFFVNSPSVLRVITKWVEELDEIIRNPEQLIKNTQNEFKDHSGLPLYLYAQIKNGLFKEIKNWQESFENRVRHIKQECYHMEVLLALEMFTADDSQRHLPREQTAVGRYCHYMRSAISSYICSELNEAIHFLLTIPARVDETRIGIADHFYQEECKKDLLSLNLIHFKIFDLLRCKCTSKESQVIYLIRRLNEKSNDPNDPFKIIRIKDRLGNGTRDILINAQIAKGLVCEIQLAVISNVDRKQEQLDQFNHFLYELKRAKLGPISENAAIWSTLDQRATYFQNLITQQERAAKRGEVAHTCINIEKSETPSVRKFIRPIICVACNTFYEIPRTCLLNVSCDRCKRTYCGECHFLHMSASQRKEYLFDRHFRPFFPYLNEYLSCDRPLPRYGFLFPRLHLKKQLLFFRVLSKGGEELEKGRVNIEIIASVVEKGKVRNFAVNECPLQAEVRGGEFYLKDRRHREELGKYIIYSIDLSKELEKKTEPLAEMFDSFQKEKLKYINLLKQPAHIDDLRLIKRNKQIRKESRELRSILPADTVLTYLRLDKTVIMVQVDVQQRVLHQELVKILNISKLRSYAVEKSFAVSMDFRQMTDEMGLIRNAPKDFPRPLYDSFCKRVTKLYLNFGAIREVTFLADFPSIRLLYLCSNAITSLAGVEKLSALEYICFDKNSVDSLMPLAGLANLTQVSGSENRIASMAGLEGLTKITILTLYKNNITEIAGLENCKLRELSLNHNPIERLESINHMRDSLEELYIGGTAFTSLDPVYSFTALRKLSLDAMHLKRIDPSLLKGLESLVYLSLADNQIEKVENLEGETSELVELNLKNNHLREISGLQSCNKLEILKLQHNFISSVAGVKAIEHLKALYLQENPLEDCPDLYYFDNALQFYFSKPEDNVDPLYAAKPSFYEKYELYEKHRAASSSGNNEDSELEQD